jgi:diacylglycerol kinase family enzyme
MLTALDADQPGPPSPGATRQRTVQAVVNAASGGVGVGAAAALAEIIERHGCELTLSTPSGAALDDAIRAAVGARPDLLVILGGDGTARLAAGHCGPGGPLLAPLPGGTLNMLPHVLYGPLPWPAALEAALTHGVEREVCGGRVGEHDFYVAAILGTPALWGSAREAIRAGKLRRAWRRGAYALRRAFTGRLKYELDDRCEGDAEALVLISPTVSKAAYATGALEVAELSHHNAGEMFRLAFHGLAGDWRRDPGITVHETLRGRARARRGIPCILDGEIQSLPRSVAFEFRPLAFRALALPNVVGGVL